MRRTNLWLTGGLLLGLWAFSTGASVEGVQQAREWQRAGDIAQAGHLWAVAYQHYDRIARAFPGTPHGRVASRRAYKMMRYLASPDRSPAAEDPGSLLEEFFNFLLWP